MGTIYAHACTMYIWLDEGDATTEKVFDYLSYAGFQQYYFKDPQNPSHQDINPRHGAALTKHTLTRWSCRRSSLPHRTGCQFMLLAASCPSSLTDM
jgi:hypothetical protein